MLTAGFEAVRHRCAETRRITGLALLDAGGHFGGYLVHE